MKLLGRTPGLARARAVARLKAGVVMGVPIGCIGSATSFYPVPA